MDRGCHRFLWRIGGIESTGIKQWLAMCLPAVVLITGSICAAIAHQSGPSSIVATFDFSHVAFAIGWVWLFFAEVPDITAKTVIFL